VAEAEDRNQVVKVLGEWQPVAQKLGESRPSVEKFNTPLERATTSSLEALVAFTQAQKMLSQASAIHTLNARWKWIQLCSRVRFSGSGLPQSRRYQVGD